MLRRKDRQFTAFLKFLCSTGIMGKLSPAQRFTLLSGLTQAKASQQLCEGLLHNLEGPDAVVRNVIEEAAAKVANRSVSEQSALDADEGAMPFHTVSLISDINVGDNGQVSEYG